MFTFKISINIVVTHYQEADHIIQKTRWGKYWVLAWLFCDQVG